MSKVWIIVRHGESLHRYFDSSGFARYGWGPVDRISAAPRSLELQHDLRSEADAAVRRFGQMCSDAEVVQVERPREFIRASHEEVS